MVTLSVHRNGHSGAIQVSINEVDEDGNGHGYRILGPKFCACHQHPTLAQCELTERDAAEISSYLARVPASERKS